MFRVKVVRHEGFDERQLEKMQMAVAQLESVLNSDAFREGVVGFRQPNGRQEFFDNEGMTNQQVYEKIMAGAETFPGGADGTADLHLHLIRKPWWRRRFGSAIGYGYPGQPDIFTYDTFFEPASVSEYAGHIAHEWCHKLGFDHSHSDSPDRPSSVPYAVGTLVERLAGMAPV